MEGRINRENNIEKFARIGFIKCGEKVMKGDKEYARSLDYFKASGKYAHYFEEAYPDKPQSIQILFLSDNIREVCFERFEIWAGKKLFGSGDGYGFEAWDNTQKKYLKYTVEKNRLDAFFDKTEQDANKIVNGSSWSVVLTLRFLIPKIGQVGGVWEFTTRAEASSIPQIRDTFDMVLQSGGTVTRTLFDLNLDWHVSKKMDSKSAYPVVSLIPNMSKQNLEKQRQLLNQHIELPFIITDEVLNKTQTKEIEYNELDEIPALEKAQILWDECKTFQDINNKYPEIKKLNLNESEWQESEKYKNGLVEKIRKSTSKD